MISMRPFPVTRRTLIGSAAFFGLAGAVRQVRAESDALSWRLLEPPTSPPARWDHTLAADETTKRLILFGGRDAGGAPFGDTWLYDLVDHEWRQIEASGPDPRFGQAVALDRAKSNLLLFGGQSGDIFYNDTWALDIAEETWSKLDAGDAIAPTPRYGLPGVIDGDGRFVVSHGFTFEGRFDDTWSFDLSSTTWTEISPPAGEDRPLKRCLHEMAWDEAGKRLILFGGCSSGFGPCPQGDLWVFDPSGGDWTQLQPSTGPSARSNPALAYDKRDRRLILIGGLSDSGYTNDIWSGVLGTEEFTWTLLNPGAGGPSPRASHDLVFARADMYLFGGTGDAGPTNELWKLTLD